MGGAAHDESIRRELSTLPAQDEISLINLAGFIVPRWCMAPTTPPPGRAPGFPRPSPGPEPG